MRYKINLFKYIYLTFILFAFIGCQDDSSLDNSNGKFGYFRVKVSKKGLTKGLVEGSPLENLNDAKKIQLDFIYNNSQISQTLSLLSVDSDAAEFGLFSETIQLLEGDYSITGYKILGEYIHGVTEGDQAPILQVGEPDEASLFSIKESQITVEEISLLAEHKGKFSFFLGKDFSSIMPDLKTVNTDGFRYNDIAKIGLDVKKGSNGIAKSYDFKTYRGEKDYLFHTDTLSLIAGEYTTTQMRLYDKNNKLIMVSDLKETIQIKDNKFTSDTLSLEMPLTPAFNDYIALYNIWKAMDGENWYWRGEEFREGANWVFTYSDGTHRPIDLWGNQPGVYLGAQGRVSFINLGGFNPIGNVPDAIGELTALQQLFLGNHGDKNIIDHNIGTASIDKSSLIFKGVDLAKERKEIAREELAIRYPRFASSLYSGKPMTFKYATTSPKYANVTNRITGISEAISKCKDLKMLSIANGMIKDLPASLSELENLTDLEILNSPVNSIPDAVLNLKNLEVFNFSENQNVDLEALEHALKSLFTGPSKDKIQILYLSKLNLTKVPDEISNLSKIGFLDLGNNKIEQLPLFGQHISFVQLYLDNNKIKSIPDNCFNINYLESMYVANNQLEEFPDLFSSDSNHLIEAVDFSGNKISRFSSSFKGVKIEKLNLNNNEFTEMPKEFSDTKSFFKFLQISENKIETIDPESILNLKYMEAFECKGNNLTKMPYNFDTETFPYLTGLDISYNQFSQFPEHVLNVTALMQFRISNQISRTTGKRTLTNWPENLHKHPALRVLDVSSNDLRKVRNFPIVLNYLDIHDNPNIHIVIPESVLYRIYEGSFKLIIDENQNVEGIG